MSSNRGSESPKPKKGVAKVVKPKKGGGKKKYDPNDYNTWNKDQLKTECRNRGLKVGGKNADLITRLQVNDISDEEEEQDDDDVDADKEVEAAAAAEKTPEAEAEPAAEASTSEAEATPPTKVNKEFKVPGSKKATMTRPFVQQNTLGGPRKSGSEGPAPGGPKPPGLGPDGRPLAPRKPDRRRTGGRPIPENGFKAVYVLPDSPAAEPGLKYKRTEIERAKAYRKAVMKIVEQIQQDNGDDDQVFNEVVNHLGKARIELSKIAKAEAIEDEQEEVEGDEEAEEDDEAVQENVDDPEDDDFSGGSPKRGKDDDDDDDDEEEEHDEDDESPPKKRGRGSRSSEESEEE